MRAACVMAVALAFGVAVVASAEVTSGPAVGDMVGAFTVTKVTGNPDDGVADGRTLCYRGKMGQRPVVMIFARSADEKLAKLCKELDEEFERVAVRSAQIMGLRVAGVDMLEGRKGPQASRIQVI